MKATMGSRHQSKAGKFFSLLRRLFRLTKSTNQLHPIGVIVLGPPPTEVIIIESFDYPEEWPQ